MIDQLATLGKVNSIGRDGFLWWIGQVAHKDSWREVNAAISLRGFKGNRVKVRIVGYHPFDPEGNILPDEDLPWAEVLADPFSGSGQGGISKSLSLVGGEMVLGFFLDGEDAQQPVIMGLFPKYDNVKNTFTAEEMKSRKSSGFEPFEAYTRPNVDQPEAVAAHQTKIKVNNNVGVGTTGGDNTKKYTKEEIVSSVAADNKKVNHKIDSATSKVERDASTKAPAWTPCKNDAIGKISQLVADFIEISQGWESAGGSWADPLTNTIIDIQGELQFITGSVQGLIRSTTNEMKKGLMKAVNKKFKKAISAFKKDPKGLFKEKKAKNAQKGIGTLIACAFNAALGAIGGFLVNMFKNLLGKVLNGAVCAVQEFTAGILAKVFDVLENSLSTIMSGLNWLLGGFDSIKSVLRSASGIASKILDFLKGCDDEACAKPSAYASYMGAKLRAPDNYADTIGKVNFLSGASEALNRASRGGAIRRGISGAIDRIFTSSEVRAYADDKGISIPEARNILTGGTNETVIDGDGVSDTKLFNDNDEPLGGLTLFDDGDFLFPDCARNNANPNSQADITPTRPGFIYPKCLPPDYEVIGSGSGAELLIVVGNSRRIFSVEVINGGSGYDTDTQITIIDNTGNGSGANVKPIIKDGAIVETVILSAGSGYCLDTKVSGIGTDVLGTVENVHVLTPGVNYDPNDTITFEGIDGVNIPIITTPSGSIVGVNFPPNILTEFRTPPVLFVNSSTGSGASFIPIMSFKGQLKIDVDADKRRATPLIGIDHVIDCIGDNRDPIGFVNGIEYSGPYHVMSSGVKMTGATHSGSDSIIYDTIEESLGKPSTVSPTSTPITPETVETSETTTPVDTTPTIVTEQITPTTPTTTPMTDTSTDTSTPPSTPPSSPPSSGGYGGY